MSRKIIINGLKSKCTDMKPRYVPGSHFGDSGATWELVFTYNGKRLYTEAVHDTSKLSAEWLVDQVLEDINTGFIEDYQVWKYDSPDTLDATNPAL